MQAANREENKRRPEGVTGRPEVAAYVATISQDLSGLARRNDLPTLAYLLDMARLEAENTARAAKGEKPTAS